MESPGLIVQFDHDGDNDSDGEVLVRPNGTFEYVPQGLVEDDYTIRARTWAWDAVEGEYVDGSWTELAAVTFTLAASHNAAASVTLLELRQNDSGMGQTPSSTDPTFVGAVDNDGRLDGLVIELDGDGVVDGTAIANADGEFLYRAQGLTPGASPQTITARVVEVDYFGTRTLSTPEEYTFILNEAPLIDELEYANDFDPTPTHTVLGVIQSSADPGDLHVEYQIFGNGTPFTPPTELEEFDPDYAIKVQDTIGSGGEFAIDVSSLGLGAATVILRSVDTSGAEPLVGPWTRFNFQILPAVVAELDITSFDLLEDTDGTSDTGSDNITSNPTVYGTVGDPGEGAYAVVEITVVVNEGPATASRVNADATGYFEFTPAGLSNNADVAVTARSIVYDPENDVEVPGTFTAPLEFTFISNEMAFIHEATFEPVEAGWETSPISDPTLTGTVLNYDGRVSGLRVEFDHDGNGTADGFAFTDQNGDFEYTPFGLASGMYTIRAQVSEWDFEAQEYVSTDWEDAEVEFELNPAGPTEPEFDEEFAANLDVIEVADGGFKDALFSVVDYLGYGSASGALDLGFGTIQLLHRGGGDAARDAEIAFDDTLFTYVAGQPLERNAADNVTIATAGGGSVTADYSISTSLYWSGSNDVHIWMLFTVTIDDGPNPYQRTVETTAAGDGTSANLEVFGEYSFYFVADAFHYNGYVLDGTYTLQEQLSYDYWHTTTVDSGASEGQSSHVTTHTTAGDYDYQYVVGQNDGSFDGGDVYEPFSYTVTTRQETWIDESGSESSDDGVHSTSRTFGKQEHSLYVETVTNSGLIVVDNGAQTVTGTLTIDATGDLTSEEWETVTYTNDYAGGDHESGTRTSHSSGLYHGQLDATIQYEAGASMSADAAFSFSDHLSGAFQETGSGASTFSGSIGGDTHETWHYAVAGSLGSALELAGTSSFTRSAGGEVHRTSHVESSLTSQAVIVGSGGGSATYETETATFSDSGTVTGRFSFSSSGHYGESAVADRVDDEFSIVGTATLGYDGTATQSATVVGHSTSDDGTTSVDAHYQIRQGAQATAGGGAEFQFQITHAGTRAAGSYHGTHLLQSSRAAQVAGTVTVDEETTPFRDNEAGTHSLDLTDRDTFTTASGEFAEGGHEHSRRGHATLVEIFTNRSSSYAGSLAIIDDEILITPGSSGRLEKGTYQRTITENFDYVEEDGQFAREGTVTDTTERTAERLETANGQDVEETAQLTSRRDGGLESTDSFAGTFSEDSSGRTASGVASGKEQRYGASKTTYVREQGTGGQGTGQSRESSTSQSKFQSTGTSNGAVEIGPDGTTLGPIHFSGHDLSRVQNRGDSFTIDATNDTQNGVKTLTVEGGSGHLRGEVTGKSSGTLRTSPSPVDLGEGASSTAHISATTDGNTGGHGFLLFSSVKTNTSAGTKDTELVVSTGSDNAKSDGHSSGEIRTGRDAGMDLTVSGQGTGDSGQSTTRLLTSAAPGASSRTTVTRTDTGDGNTNTGGTIKVEDGQTERDGTFSGNSDNTATVVYTYHANSAPSKSFELATGTLTTDVGVNFSGTSKSTNRDSDTTLDATVKRDDSENSLYVTGWFDHGEVNDETFYEGEIRTFTVNAKDNTKGTVHLSPSPSAGEGLGEGSADIEVTLEGGSSGGTETTAITKWDYRAGDDFFSKLDYAWQSSTTTHTTPDEEGNASHRQSTVEAWTSDFYKQTTDDDPGSYAWRLYTATETKQETGINAQTATISGPENERRHTLAIDSYFESLDETAERETTQHATLPTITDTREAVREEDVRSSHYRSNHKTNAAGLAYDGSFSVSGREWERVADTYDTWSDSYYDFGSGGDSGYGDYLWDHSIHETDVAFNESGGYYDRPLAGGNAARIQAGDYQRTEDTSNLTDKGGGDGYSFTHVRGGQYDADFYSDDEWQDTIEELRRTTTEGHYDEHGIEETRGSSYSYESLSTGWHYYEGTTEDPLQDDYWWWTKNRTETKIHIPAEGKASGRTDEDFWTDNYSEFNQSYVYAPSYYPGGWVPANTYWDWHGSVDLFDGQTPESGLGPQETEGEYVDGGVFSISPERIEPQYIEPSWWVGLKAGAGQLWDTVKLWDNEEWDTNAQNLQDAGHGGFSAGLVGFIASIGERGGAGGLADAVEGRSRTGEQSKGTGVIYGMATGVRCASSGPSPRSLVGGVNIIALVRSPCS